MKSVSTSSFTDVTSIFVLVCHSKRCHLCLLDPKSIADGQLHHCQNITFREHTETQTREGKLNAGATDIKMLLHYYMCITVQHKNMKKEHADKSEVYQDQRRLLLVP